MNRTPFVPSFSWPHEGGFLSSMGLNIEPTSAELIQKTLLDPVHDFLSKPGKQFRARLVETGFRFSRPETARALTSKQKAQCEHAAGIVEAIHAGALIIDDIQDGSRTRRNSPSFHIRHGVPKSINAANWLYFWPLTQIQAMDLPKERELQMIRGCLQVLNVAHLGQAIDIGTPIDQVPQDQVHDVSLTSMRLKTGVLVSLATSLGAWVAGASPERVQVLSRLGCELGLSLQKFDDAGTFSSEQPGSGKRHEDLILRRPSWVWAFAAQRCSPKDYADFLRAARHLPDESYLRAWVGLHEFDVALKREAKSHLDQVLESFRRKFGVSHPRAMEELSKLAGELEKSYG